MGARIVAITALFAVAGALAFVVMNAPAERDRTPSVDVSGLGAPLEAVAVELERIGLDGSARPAQRAVRRAMDTAEALKVRSEITAGDRVVNAVERTVEYLDATGSLLSNRRSPLKNEIAERAERARAALDAAPGGDEAAAAIRGWQRLVERAKR